MAKNKPFYTEIWFIALVILAIVGLWFIGSYNNFVSLNQKIDAQWAQVENQYQRRIDLIPNLINSVKGYMQFEQSLLTDITALRSQWMSASTVEDKVNYGNALDSALGRLMVVYENYPELQSIEAVSSLMFELSGTENRISVERMRFNEVMRDYNTAVQMFPSNIVASMFGYTQKPYFEAQEGSEIPPIVDLTI